MSGNVLLRGLCIVVYLSVPLMGCSDSSLGVSPSDLVCVNAGWFEMGRSYEGGEDDDERPLHRVYLDEYAIGRFPVTNQQFVEVLNWALKKGILQNSEGTAYDGDEIYAYGKPLADTVNTGLGSQINAGIEKFEVLVRKGYGNQQFSMEQHPMQHVTWYGAVVYCNWLSEIHQLQPCYDTITWTRINPLPDGYRLPSEAEWDRAAAWDGKKQWRYGISSDELDVSHANYYAEDYANPMGFTTMPFTSPVGWYNGLNPVKLSDPERITIRGTSPAGCFDMAGNIWEWCHDWYGEDYYAKSGIANPIGPLTGTYRVGRGGSWRYSATYCRAADRYYNWPEYCSRYQGFRIAISPPPPR
ncbi:MAG: SUMF1/EgtB/PvdO family nonheme iron enzyme [Candidatus Hydrogenedentes bacterium]|nr:SUMF1/EgtB/PvdO family nonheme iron enzyme [Candidatus Hydrogenedentota bacterium]